MVEMMNVVIKFNDDMDRLNTSDQISGVETEG